ncbi:hypothetical protein FG379_003019 [Cryptosporidium bovis]|uniref:uncharacterized protein n=1 Tax=Cryptosporidium bovis TaxID=310047 RepID=UPI003519FE3B|nr:hypothetical protein FG379_003019 [Cryptosporidium bovis]
MFSIIPTILKTTILCFSINYVICNGPTTVNEFLPFVSAGSAITSCIFTFSNSIIAYKRAYETKRKNKGFSDGISQSILKSKENKLRGKVFIENKDETPYSDIFPPPIKTNGTIETNITELMEDFNSLKDISMINSSNLLVNVTVFDEESNFTNSNYSSKIISLGGDDFMFDLQSYNFVIQNESKVKCSENITDT